MANSVDPDQTAPEGAVWSGSTLFAYVILSDALVFEFLGHLPYILEDSNFSFGYIKLCDLDITREKWLNYLQTVETLIRYHVLRHLIWVYTVCHLLF